MGTLINQPIRQLLTNEDRDVSILITRAIDLAKKTGLSIDQVLKVFEIKEMERKNDLMVYNGNIHDEQMSGIGELLQ